MALFNIPALEKARIISVEGIQGTGKSLLCTSILVDNYRESIAKATGRRTIANTELRIPYTHLSLQYFLEHFEDDEITNCDLWMDELYQVMDSRSSGRKINKMLTYFIVQARKRNVLFLYCTHHIDHVDLRVRRAADVRISAQFVDEDPCLRCMGTGHFPEEYQVLGALGEVFPEDTCGRCFGSGKTGWCVPLIYNKRAKTRRERYFRVRVPGALYWNYYISEERIPLTAKQKKVDLEDL